LLVSQPLHFGDYGGVPLKVLWASLDVITIVVLASGLYLWWTRRRVMPTVLAREDDIDETAQASSPASPAASAAATTACAKPIQRWRTKA
jgi:uncharacterized iron-regulated membrane protein